MFTFAYKICIIRRNRTDDEKNFKCGKLSEIKPLLKSGKAKANEQVVNEKVEHGQQKQIAIVDDMTVL